MIKVAVIGKQGQLARSIACLAPRHPDLDLIFLGRPELDLLDPESVHIGIAKAAPAIVINTAAWTDVDGAEDQPELAFRINADGAGAVAEASAACGATLVHLSTDYVFDGKAERPYREQDSPAPLNLYGASKLRGENAVRATGRSIVIRTSWLYSPFGRNFLKTMLDLARQGIAIRIVADQIGCPTSALDLADALLASAPRLTEIETDLFHFAGDAPLSWFDFARAIFDAAKFRPAPTLIPVSTEEWGAKAARPKFSVLDGSLFRARFGYVPPVFRDSLARVVEVLREREQDVSQPPAQSE